MPRRSVLFSPGDRPELLRNAPTTGADTVVFDLEDAVAPERKTEAGAAVREALAALDTDCEVCVRVRPPGRGAAADLDAVLDGDARAGLDALVLPKAESADDVTDLADLAAERDADLPVLALVETAAGVLHAEAIAAAEPTAALVFGAEDLAADIGATRTEEGTEVLHAREHVVLAAAAAGVDAVDTLYTDFEDEAGLRADTEFALELGYDGKLAIHPSQVGPINETFTPDPDRVEWAERVLAARDEADAEGRGVFAVDGEMVDAPLVTQAERVLERARAAGVRE
ncbi:HpcH/HpaI aldolase/citrate lyase family protein [Halosimplex pelagicum]|uniref:CoA ester lyase n=1 Tax=Halosimplex pelagicum TaxID=869886 RepID=A0A7D5PBS5_9EURY|nr:CoA ester lyase [Halosimplex pelagicum]QLH82665.1 CoA ester lyase [Halosimplex pelagicum]